MRGSWPARARRIVARRRWFALAILALPLVVAAPPARTQPIGQPAITVKPAGEQSDRRHGVALIVPFAAGGPTDALARTLAPPLARGLGEPVTVQNIAGAGGTRGALAAVQAGNDGRTLLLHHVGMATAPALYRNLPYDPQRDFTPVGRVVDVPMTLIVRRDFPGRTFGETTVLLRQPRAAWLVAYAGLGAASHLCGLLLSEALGVDLIQIPYQGTGPAIKDLIAGRVDLMCDQTTNTVDAIAAGQVRALAVTSDRPLVDLPQVPTATDLGMEGLRLSIWHGLFVPGRAPAPVVERLSRALGSAQRDPEFTRTVERVHGFLPAADDATPQALARLLAGETRRWGALIRRAGQYAD
ncbi:MAG: tripartite tricarboxylate transporter substrate-binding protein [Burkholderiaceae bacterium]